MCLAHVKGLERSECFAVTRMSTTIDMKRPVVSNGEMQAARELCVGLEGLGLLKKIEGDSQSRHNVWMLTAKGKEAMSFEMCNNDVGQIENAR
jgi:hypothetical protein